MSDGPRILRVGEELPPMDSPGRPLPPTRARTSTRGKGSSSDAKATAQGRFATLNAFVDGAMSGLSRAEVAVWLVLFRDSRDGTATTSQADMARRAGLNVRNVRRALDRLQAADLVEVIRRGGLARGASCYRVRGERSRQH